ncbi:perlucin isoform X2 [Acyrthosiphon pisum]|uniref:C-type lectin domain-containing protein n=1 Tax=Acyrthosiphon pisum TaxID=7029 RepID=A0A8R2D6V4_ACYPI|nr:perlucin isoform X2 [Acyrthosiphon pisum]|eukprot:XP_016663197.1 PREDICTED: perlucin isoform X2 [Acyrthosiphon pisum]
MYYSGLYRANMNSWTDTAARSIILFLTLFMCFVATRSQIAVPRTAHKLNEPQGECNNNNCVEDSASVINKWSLPLLRSGDKKLYLGIFFKANWYKAAQYCRYHGMHLASISNQEENDKLEKYIKDNGLGHEHFWTSGTDQAEEGSFFWLANGRPIGYTNWNAGEPNNFKYENGEEEHCLELWNRDGKGLKWNDSPCSFETFFVCEM